MRRRQRIVISVLIGLILILGSVRMYILGRLDALSIYYYGIQVQIDVLHRENMVLRSELLREEALTTIASEASSLGFQKAQYYYLQKK